MLKYFLATNAHDMVFIRNSFRRFVYLAIILLLVNYALVAYLYINLLTRAQSPNFATTTDGRIININPE